VLLEVSAAIGVASGVVVVAALGAAGGIAAAAAVVDLALRVDLLALVDKVSVFADSLTEVDPMGAALVLNARPLSSCLVVHAAILISVGMEIVVDANAWFWLTMTALVLGPVPTRQRIKCHGCKWVPPNFVQLCML
jgi:hypothetical protein